MAENEANAVKPLRRPINTFLSEVTQRHILTDPRPNELVWGGERERGGRKETQSPDPLRISDSVVDHSRDGVLDHCSCEQ